MSTAHAKPVKNASPQESKNSTGNERDHSNSDEYAPAISNSHKESVPANNIHSKAVKKPLKKIKINK